MKISESILIISLIGISLTMTSCEKMELPVEVPTCVEKQIKQIEKEKESSAPRQVWKWEVDGDTYFYITSNCCDQFNFLYDENCEVVCAPDGGFTGAGDGKCPEFSEEIVKTLVWEKEDE